MIHSDKKEFLKLTDKYLDGTASKEEVEVIEAYYSLFSGQPEVLERIDGLGLNQLEQKIKQKIHNKIREQEGSSRKYPVVRPLRIWYRISVAALLLISLSTAFYFYFGRPAANSAMYINASNDVEPGTNKAILTLAGGKKVILNDVPQGTLAAQEGIVISKAKNGELIYTLSPDIEGKTPADLNTVSTPRGGQYQVRLADGTKVWLNAESSIRFPSSFSGLKERIVELDGEAYFEVAKIMIRDDRAKDRQRRMSFIVKNRKQEVKVLGTHFNIQSYTGEGNIKTTLLEGAVLVSALEKQPVMLKPNQQSVLTAKTLQVSDVDVEQAIAWKEGLFMFNEEDLESIMFKIARWYNVDIRFDDEILKHRVFSGSFSRFTNVSKVLQKIELTHAARFNVKGGVITVYKY